MAIPVRNYSLKSQNSRVNNLAGNNDSIKYQVTGEISASSIGTRRDVDNLIEQTYKQIFFHAMSCDRDIYLESQLRSGYITMRDFVRGLLLSERFQQGYFHDCFRGAPRQQRLFATCFHQAKNGSNIR